MRMRKNNFEKKLYPHRFSPTVGLFNGFQPRVVVELEAYTVMTAIVMESVFDESSWLGTVEREEDNTLFIEDILLFEGEDSAASTTISQESLALVASEMIKEGNAQKVNAIKFWGHIHPGNSTASSFQDDDQMRIFSDGNKWFLRGIFSREGRAEFTFYDYEKNLVFYDVPWEIGIEIPEATRERIRKKMAKRTKLVQYSGIYPGGFSEEYLRTLGYEAEGVEPGSDVVLKRKGGHESCRRKQ